MPPETGLTAVATPVACNLDEPMIAKALIDELALLRHLHRTPILFSSLIPTGPPFSNPQNTALLRKFPMAECCPKNLE